MTSRNSMQIYLKDIGEIALLSREEERELAIMAKEDDDAHRKLIRSNLRLVVSIAKRYANCGLPFLDLVEEGNIGLMKAVEKYDVARGCRLSTYASWWIRQSIIRALANQGKIVRIPVYMVEKMSAVKKVIEKFTLEHDRQPNNDEIAEAAGETVQAIIEIQNYLHKPSYLFGSVNEDEVCDLIDMLEDTDAQTPLQFLCSSTLKSDIIDLLDLLSEREANVLLHRFGLSDDDTPKTLEEIGGIIGVTRERVRQIEKVAIQKLQDIIQEYNFEFSDYSS